MSDDKITRPVLTYPGGKFRDAHWIIGHFGPHKYYTEVYGGGANVLLRKPRAHTEVYNGRDDELVNLFEVLRDPDQSALLVDMLYFTPFARSEFELAHQHHNDPVERARRTIVKSMMGVGTAGIARPHLGKAATGFRSRRAPKQSFARDWAMHVEYLPPIVERLRGVVIENRPALDVLRQQDTIETLHYVDPPYPPGARGWSGAVYRHEMPDDDQHRELAECLHALDGMVVLSGYACALYDEELFSSWMRVEKPSRADGGRARIEVLWLNDAAHRALPAQLPLPIGQSLLEEA